MDKKVCKDCGSRGKKGCKGWCPAIGEYVPRKKEACEKFWSKKR